MLLSEEIDRLLEKQISKSKKSSFVLLERIDDISTLMQKNISLPLIVDYLETKGIKTNIQMLRRFIVRNFGREEYDKFLYRNGWHKSKKPKQIATKKPETLDDKNLSNAERIRQTALSQIAESENRFKLD